LNNAAFELFQKRRQLGWGVDPVRCLAYMTSSQTLTLNLVGVLATDPDWLLAVFSRVLRRGDLRGVTEVLVEHGVRYDLLGDKTLVDMLIKFQTDEGPHLCVVEVKLADRFNSRLIPVWENRRYQRLAADSDLWVDPDVSLRERKVNQLVRCHALAVALQAQAASLERPPSLVVLHHPLDDKVAGAVTAYRNVLTDPSCLHAWSLQALIRFMSTTAPNKNSRQRASDLATRYTELRLSEEAWKEYEVQRTSG
jgi:hypothetical protein